MRCLCWWLMVCWMVPSFGTAGYIVSTFSDPDEGDVLEFNHLTVDEHTGRVYIGAVNRLYQLVSDLELVYKVVTGPSLDSPDCSFQVCPSNVEKTLTNNVNKALVIDRSHGKLIECGSLFQGVCTVRQLENIKSDVRMVNEPVVANNSTASTVAFIAPGPRDQSHKNPLVLYVGVTYTGNSYYRGEVPAVSSRSLNPDNMFSLARTAVTTGTRMFVYSLSREKYPIHYVYGFSHDGFSYFLTIQMKFSNGASSPYISKLVRVCQNDPDYYSYTEIPLECKDQKGRHYSLVQAAYMGHPGSDLASLLRITAQDDALFAVFSQPNEELSSQPGPSSAICIYSLKYIRRMFLQNIQKCFNGQEDRGLDFISPSFRCIKTKLTSLKETFCGADVNSPLGGEIPVLALASKTWNEQLTAVAATSTSNHTVIFVGTATGHLKKLAIEPNNSSNENNLYEYSDLVIDEGSPVNPDLRFDVRRRHLYVMTKRKVSKVKVQQCEDFKTCSDCMAAKDPYCGWCFLKNTCSSRRECPDADYNPQLWISYHTDGKCPTITSVSPNQLQIIPAGIYSEAIGQTLKLHVENLPIIYYGEFQCGFTAMSKTLYTDAFLPSQSRVFCPPPRTELLPKNRHGQVVDHFTATLSVFLKSMRHGIASTNFTFFNCGAYSSCSECVSSQFPCSWCIHAHRCSHDTAEDCRDDTVVTGVSSTGPSLRSGSSYCPGFELSYGQTEVLVPSGTIKKIRVRANDAALEFLVLAVFKCEVNIEGRVTITDAVLVGNTIHCGTMRLTYVSRSYSPNVTASFRIIYDHFKYLENLSNMHFVIYQCRNMAHDCDTCVALPQRYNCGWCESSAKCKVEEQCEETDSFGWLERDEVCPFVETTTTASTYEESGGRANETDHSDFVTNIFYEIYASLLDAFN